MNATQRLVFILQLAFAHLLSWLFLLLLLFLSSFLCPSWLSFSCATPHHPPPQIYQSFFLFSLTLHAVYCALLYMKLGFKAPNNQSPTHFFSIIRINSQLLSSLFSFNPQKHTHLLCGSFSQYPKQHRKHKHTHNTRKPQMDDLLLLLLLACVLAYFLISQTRTKDGSRSKLHRAMFAEYDPEVPRFSASLCMFVFCFVLRA